LINSMGTGMKLIFNHRSLLKATAFLACAVFAALIVFLFVGTRPVKALPEYAALTGESCGVCHVNPGGGGPRTLRGLLWAAQGKPAQVPALPTMLLAPDVQDGYELFGIACATCHGAKGEGSSAMRLAGTGITGPATRSYLLNGLLPFGMPAFKGQLTDAQVTALVNFVTDLASGKALPPNSYPLAPAQLHGKPAQPKTEREGN
jgi:mono/diheme cytochrome c family protein